MVSKLQNIWKQTVHPPHEEQVAAPHEQLEEQHAQLAEQEAELQKLRLKIKKGSIVLLAGDVSQVGVVVKRKSAQNQQTGQNFS